MEKIKIEDRFEVNDLLVKYCHYIDGRDWEKFRSLFIVDSLLDLSAFQGPVGSIDTAIEYFQSISGAIPKWQHTISTSLLSASGESIKARTAAQVMLVSSDDAVTFTGLWYNDEIVKTEEGWKFRSRSQEYGWIHNMQA